MPTTSNFGWTTPADTDLVKDGAAAIRTLGNGVDASFIDLKGGTTGQVLSKASNTDLDYSWVTPNVGDITEVQAGTGISVASGTGPIPVVTNTVATAFDAAGDLVYGTGADTFTKLSLGTAGQVLTVNSGATAPQWSTAGGGDLVKISSVTWTAASAQSLTSVFSATYDSYMIVFDDMQGTAAANAFSWRLRSGSTNDTNSTYYFANLGLQVDNTASNSNGSPTNTFSTSSLVESPHKCGMVLWMFNPYNSVRTSCVWQTFGNTASNFVYRTGGGLFAANTSFDGLGFFLSGGGDISGNVTVYGLKK